MHWNMFNIWISVFCPLLFSVKPHWFFNKIKRNLEKKGVIKQYMLNINNETYLTCVILCVVHLLRVANWLCTIRTCMLWVFVLKQFEEWRFCLSGIGLVPRPLNIERITTYLNLHSSTFIRFHNPTKEHVLVDIILTSKLFFLCFHMLFCNY